MNEHADAVEDVPVEFNGRGVYHAQGQFNDGRLLLWAQNDRGEIVATATPEPAEYRATVDDLEDRLRDVEAGDMEPERFPAA